MSEPLESGGKPVTRGHDVLFTQRMRAASKHIHRSSDNLVNLKLIIAFTNRERYGAALSLFYHVFRALEEHMAALTDDPGTCTQHVPCCCPAPHTLCICMLVPRHAWRVAIEWDCYVDSPPIAVGDAVLRQLSAMLPEFERAPAFETDLAYLMG